MRRPSSLIFLIGNPVSALAIFAGTAVVVYQWWFGRAADIAAILAVFGLMITINASDQVTNYHHWKREWDALEGRSTGTRLSPSAVRIGHIVVGTAIWAAMAYGALHMKPGPNTQIAVLSFWGGSALLIAGAIYRLWKGRAGKRPAQRRAPVDVPVEVMVIAPPRSPSVNAAIGALPGFCRRLL